MGILIVKCYSDLDPDALNYIRAVELADGQPLEVKTRKAFNDFVLGCKADGIWSALSHACILCGARTLAGAFTPLNGVTPSYDLTSDTYNRKTGVQRLASGGSTGLNILLSNIPRWNNHISAYILNPTFDPLSPLIGQTALRIAVSSSAVSVNNVTSSSVSLDVTPQTGLFGTRRSSNSSWAILANGVVTNQTSESTAYNGNPMGLNIPRVGQGRMLFYSLGTSLTLSLLNNRVDQLITNISNAF